MAPPLAPSVYKFQNLAIKANQFLLPRFLIIPTTPIKPAPKRKMEPGSGIGVVPLATVIDALMIESMNNDLHFHRQEWS